MNMEAHGAGPTIFERSGGFGSVRRIVMDFYDRVLDSDILGPWFENVDMRALVDRQTKFVASLMGGPASYRDETLARVHARLGITRAAFDEMKQLLADAMEDYGMAPRDIDGVMRKIERCAPLIVTV